MQPKFDIQQIAPDDYPFKSHWFEHREGQVHYVDEGEGLPVIMLHGNPTWSYLYRHVIRNLTGSVRCIAIDYPGFGLSTPLEGYRYTAPEHAATVLALIDHLKLERYILLLQDWGGPIGMHVATQHAERVAGLVLCNTWCWRASFGMKLFAWATGGPIGRYLIKYHNLFAKTFMKGALEYQSPQPQQILDAYTAPFPTPASRIGTWVFPKEINQSSEWMAQTANHFHLLKDVPVEFVWGMQDLAFKHSTILETWKNYFPQGHWTLVEDASHFLQETAHQEIAEAVLRVCHARDNG